MLLGGNWPSVMPSSLDVAVECLSLVYLLECVPGSVLATCVGMDSYQSNNLAADAHAAKYDSAL